MLTVETQEELNDFIIKYSEIILFFTAKWCLACKAIYPIINTIDDNKKIFVKIDCDKNYNIACEYRILSLPTFINIKNGEVINRSTGVISKEKLIKFIKGE